MFRQFENAINKVIEGYRIIKIIGKSENQLLQIKETLKSGGNERLEIILKSIVEKNCLKLTCQGFGRQQKGHEFSVYLLKEYWKRWYAVGFSNRAKNIIVLALDRVNNITISKSKYVPGDKFIPAEFFNYSLGITQIHDANPSCEREN